MSVEPEDKTVTDIDDMNRALCEALGVDIDKEKIKSVRIHICAMEPPEVLIQKYIPDDRFGRLCEVVKTLKIDES